MSNDAYDIEWRCECGHTNPDCDVFCNGCGKYRYYGEQEGICQGCDGTGGPSLSCAGCNGTGLNTEKDAA